jgi:hypothetical protein
MFLTRLTCCAAAALRASIAPGSRERYRGWMPIGYQDIDAHIVDYETYQLPGVRGVFRGPPINGDEYVACLGAAQTFGRFVKTPFPTLIARTLGIGALNLGRGGAGSTFYLSNPRLMEYVDHARVVVVQVLSARSQSNSLFRIVGHGMLGINLADGCELSADQFYTRLMGKDVALARRIVAETRENYVLAMTQLLDAIKPPKILFWFSVRSPEYQERWELPLSRLWGTFPQFVNQAMLDRLRSRATIYVECISRRGLPQRLFDQNGNPTSFKVFSPSRSEVVMNTENRYYPSPEMHEDAAALLIPACRQILDRGAGE